MKILNALLLVVICLPSCRQRESVVKNISGNETVDFAPLSSKAIVLPNWGANNEFVTNIFKPDNDSQEFLEQSVLTAENLKSIDFSDYEKTIMESKGEGFWHTYEHQLSAVMLQCVRTSINKAIKGYLKTDSKLWQQLTQTFKLVDKDMSDHLVVIDRLDLDISDSVSEISGKYAYISVGFNSLSLSLINKNLYQDFLNSIPLQTKYNFKTVVKGVTAKGQTDRSKVRKYMDDARLETSYHKTKILFKNSECSFDYSIEIPLALAVKDMKDKYSAQK